MPNFNEKELKIFIESNVLKDIKKIKDLAIDRLINRERNRAAKIFLMAKKAEDPEKRKELLLSSYDILIILIERYPSSSLINKLNDHLQKVRDELDRLNTELE